VTQALVKGARITGDRRAELATEYAKRYAGGESIRAIAAESGRSFGFVHGVLVEAGVALRGRGGATRGDPPGDATTNRAKAPGASEKKGPTTKTAKAPAAKKAPATKTAKAPATKTARAPAAKKAPATKTAR